MSDITYREDIEFLKNGLWGELYVLSEHWKSDLEFYRDDLRFLHRLIDKYFIWITKQKNLEMVKDLKVGLCNLKANIKDLLEKVSKHRIQIGYLVVDSSKADSGIIRTEYEHLEEEMALFIKSFRENRKEVFKITEYIIDSEQLANIIET